MRRQQRHKKKNTEDTIPGLQKWHSTFRERCIQFGKDKTFDSKWGKLKPYQRINVDQSLFAFVTDAKRIYEYIKPGAKDHNTWISLPGSGLDKRQCSLQVMLCSEGKQPRLAIIFHGKGKRISLD